MAETEPAQEVEAATDPALPPVPVLDDDAAPPLPTAYPQAAYDAMTPSLMKDDERTGRVMTILLCGLFLYTILAMGYIVYLTWQWTTAA